MGQRKWFYLIVEDISTTKYNMPIRFAPKVKQIVRLCFAAAISLTMGLDRFRLAIDKKLIDRHTKSKSIGNTHQLVMISMRFGAHL